MWYYKKVKRGSELKSAFVPINVVKIGLLQYDRVNRPYYEVKKGLIKC